MRFERFLMSPNVELPQNGVFGNIYGSLPRSRLMEVMFAVSPAIRKLRSLVEDSSKFLFGDNPAKTEFQILPQSLDQAGT